MDIETCTREQPVSRVAGEPRFQPISFAPIARHGAIGDRRTGALVAADGTLDWFCAPEFDSPPVCGSLLDPNRGGFCYLGPAEAALGEQFYIENTAALVTRWERASGPVELTDVMGWPDDTPAADHQRVIIRRLRGPDGAAARLALAARSDFEPPIAYPTFGDHSARFQFPAGTLAVWASFPFETQSDTAHGTVALTSGTDQWLVLGWNLNPDEWSASRVQRLFDDALVYWRRWSSELEVPDIGPRAASVRRSAITVQLLSHAHLDSTAAALTTSLPERIGGDRNYDYRYAWVRDGSLALSLLARLGKIDEVRRYLDWLACRESETEAPLQVVYRMDGGTRLDEWEAPEVLGYMHSRPVVVGNRAARQRQIGSLGFMVDCVRIYVEQGGELSPEHWKMIHRAANYTAMIWQNPDSGIWELQNEAHYVASKVMAWVVMERAAWIGSRLRLGHPARIAEWRDEASRIHSEVMRRGWNPATQSFRERYDSDAIDAAALLIPLMGFLPSHHPYIHGVLEAIDRHLVVDGLVHRFDPAVTLGVQRPIGEFEGAFLPCVFWHAHALAKAGRVDEAERILERCEAVAGEPRLFSEEIDARRHVFLGNTPLLFSHVEYVRAAMEIHRVRAGLKS